MYCIHLEKWVEFETMQAYSPPFPLICMFIYIVIGSIEKELIYIVFGSIEKELVIQATNGELEDDNNCENCP